MAYLMGENIQLGVGIEGARGTSVEPDAWIPARTPTGIVSIVEKVQIKETRGTGISSVGSEIVQLRAEGDLQFNLRAITIGYIFKSLLGATTPTTALGATTHVFTRDDSPQFPTLTLALAQPGQQSYDYPMAVVSKLEIKTPVNDLVNATATFVAQKEETHAAFTPAFDTDDVYFRNHDVTIKFASDLTGLDAAPEVAITDFAITIANNSRPNMVLGNVNPADIYTLITDISGSFTADFTGVTSYYDIFTAGTYKAMRIKMTRDDLSVIGTSALYPTVQIDLAKVSFDGYKPNRPLADIVTEQVNFTGHYSETDSKAIEVTVINDLTTYATGS